MDVIPSDGTALDAAVDRLLSTRERVIVERDGNPVAAVVSLRDLDGLDRSVELLSDPRIVRRIVEAEAAIQRGNLFMGEELAALDPDAMFVARAVSGGVALAASMRSGGGNRWDLVAGTAARDAIDGLAAHVADAVRRFIFGPLLDNPAASGTELRGYLSRRFASRIETTLVIYRLDSVKRVVRLIEVVHVGGTVGEQESSAKRW